MHIPISLRSKESVGKLQALVNSGAQGKFIHQDTVTRLNLVPTPLEQTIQAYNVDGTPNRLGRILHYVETQLNVAGRTIPTKLLVTNLGKHDVILGFDWLQETNPRIDWSTGQVHFTRTSPRKLNRQAELLEFALRAV